MHQHDVVFNRVLIHAVLDNPHAPVPDEWSVSPLNSAAGSTASDSTSFGAPSSDAKSSRAESFGADSPAGHASPGQAEPVRGQATSSSAVIRGSNVVSNEERVRAELERELEQQWSKKIQELISTNKHQLEQIKALESRVADQEAQIDGMSSRLEIRDEERSAIEVALASMNQGGQNLRTQFRKMLLEMSTATRELAVAIATKVVHDRLETGEAVEAIVQEVVSRLETSDPISVRLHPEDLRLLQERITDDSVLGSGHIQFLSDPELARGDCTAEANDLTATSRLDQQLAEIRSRLLAAGRETESPDS